MNQNSKSLYEEPRDARGRFAKGNSGGPGNPLGGQVARLRSAMLTAVSVEDMQAIVRQLVELAKGGNVQAAKEVFDRCLGRPVEADLLERIGELEDALLRIVADGEAA